MQEELTFLLCWLFKARSLYIFFWRGEFGGIRDWKGVYVIGAGPLRKQSWGWGLQCEGSTANPRPPNQHKLGGRDPQGTNWPVVRRKKPYFWRWSQFVTPSGDVTPSGRPHWVLTSNPVRKGRGITWGPLWSGLCNKGAAAGESCLRREKGGVREGSCSRN